MVETILVEVQIVGQILQILTGHFVLKVFIVQAQWIYVNAIKGTYLLKFSCVKIDLPFLKPSFAHLLLADTFVGKGQQRKLVRNIGSILNYYIVDRC